MYSNRSTVVAVLVLVEFWPRLHDCPAQCDRAEEAMVSLQTTCAIDEYLKAHYTPGQVKQVSSDCPGIFCVTDWVGPRWECSFCLKFNPGYNTPKSKAAVRLHASRCCPLSLGEPVVATLWLPNPTAEYGTICNLHTEMEMQVTLLSDTTLEEQLIKFVRRAARPLWLLCQDFDTCQLIRSRWLLEHDGDDCLPSWLLLVDTLALCKSILPPALATFAVCLPAVHTCLTSNRKLLRAFSASTMRLTVLTLLGAIHLWGNKHLCQQWCVLSESVIPSLAELIGHQMPGTALLLQPVVWLHLLRIHFGEATCLYSVGVSVPEPDPREEEEEGEAEEGEEEEEEEEAEGEEDDTAAPARENKQRSTERSELSAACYDALCRVGSMGASSWGATERTEYTLTSVGRFRRSLHPSSEGVPGQPPGDGVIASRLSWPYLLNAGVHLYRVAWKAASVGTPAASKVQSDWKKLPTMVRFSVIYTTTPLTP